MTRDSNNNTPLHSLCGRGSASPDLLELLFSFCSNEYGHLKIPSTYELISAQNMQGCTPLHYCSECRCDLRSIQIMLGHCSSLAVNKESLIFPIEPDPSQKNDSSSEENRSAKGIERTSPLHPCLIQDEDGDLPLHYALSCGAYIAYIDVLLKPCPQAIAIRNTEGNTPFCDLWNWAEEQWLETYNDFFPNLVPYHSMELLFSIFGSQAKELENLPDDDQMSWTNVKQDFRNHFWEILNICLEASCFGTTTRSTIKKDNIWFPLHAAASLTYFPQLMIFCLYMIPDQILNYNNHGMLPIHSATSTTSKYASPIRNVKGMWIASTSCEMFKSKTRSEYEMLPLHIAIKSGKDLELILFLCQRYPNALSIPVKKSGLLPWMLAAEEDNNSLNVAFSLLRMNPELVRYGIQIPAQVDQDTK